MTPDKRQELAAEFALRVLEGEELARARDMLRDDPQFAAEVAAWSGRLAPLLDGIEPVSPPAHVLSAIEQRIGRGEANDNAPDLRRSRNLWRGAAVCAGTIAASLALIVLVPQTLIKPEPIVVAESPAPMVAVMEAEDNDARLVATWNAGDQSLVVAAAAGIAPVAGRSHELWVIPADGLPRSIGLLRGAEPMHFRVAPPMARQLAEGATLALSVEPTGGSPTGLPTGPVIAAGKLART